MSAFSKTTTYKLVLSMQYSQSGVEYHEHYFCHNVNMWRDVFPQGFADKLGGAVQGDRITLSEHYLIAPFEPGLQYTVRLDQWQPPKELPRRPEPRTGRWYPQGYLRGVPGIFPQLTKPVLIRSMDGEKMEIDCNHPLAGVPLRVAADIVEVSSKDRERGGRCTDWFEEMTNNGPGMQLVRDGIIPDYHEEDGTVREDEREDSRFYREPRLIDHIDSLARAHLRQAMATWLRPEMKILDLMSSMQSHLPEGYSATGLGMNEQELRANPQLSEIVVQDLNSEPRLPFDDASFDCVCCHLSIEYLLEPTKIMAEIRRVLRAGGLVVVSFSNRWFPPKVTRLWQLLHEYERPRYVLELLRDGFTQLRFESFRNWPRPYDDAHAHLLYYSDPLYIVAGQKK